MKKPLFVICLFMSTLGMMAVPPASCGITFCGGDRLGDKLKAYVKAKYFAHQLKIPFLCAHFEYDDQFVLADHETWFDSCKTNQFRSQQGLYTTKNFCNPAQPTLFFVPYKVSDTEFIEQCHDKKFVGMIKKLLKPRNPIAALTIPDNVVSIAVHIRRGGGYDVPLSTEKNQKKFCMPSESKKNNPEQHPSDKVWPLKFPPLAFYAQQIKKISSLTGNNPLYVHIFTDDADPAVLVEQIRGLVNVDTVHYGFRTHNNTYTTNVVEDLFHMARFDCLIRPDSGLSLMAEFVGNHMVRIKPIEHSWRNNRLHVTKSELKWWPARLKPPFVKAQIRKKSLAYQIVEQK